MKKTESKIRFIESISAASGWNEVGGKPQEDGNYIAFCRMMLYRKEVAIKYLEAKTDVEKDNYATIYKQCNQKIRAILNLLDE